jgi:hypothetical protein
MTLNSATLSKEQARLKSGLLLFLWPLFASWAEDTFLSHSTLTNAKNGFTDRPITGRL